MLPISLAASTNDLATALQKGLFEEEANHNYPAAIEAYQGVINRFDEDRKLAATAIFRVGEVYRKQGKTNEANAQYERIIREFSDQSALATLSQSYLAAATTLSVNAPKTNNGSELALTSDEAEEVRKIRALIRDSPDLINAPDNNGNTRLHIAASSGQVVVARFLIENGADVNAQNRFGSTPLHNAAGGGHKALVELLLDHGASTQSMDPDGTPLHVAARRGFRSIIEVLLAHRADVNARNSSGSTPLHLAVVNGFKSIAELLLNSHSDLNAVTSDARDEQQRVFNGTPLHIAALRDDQPIAEMLLANKANPNATNSTGDTPLHIAANRGNAKLIELFLANKANVDTINKKGETPLDLAVTRGHTNAVGVLLAHGANVNASTSIEAQYNGWTPLLYAANARHTETVILLLKRGADPNASTGPYGPNWTKGTTALLMAAAAGDSDIVAALLDAKADPNVRDAKELSPVFMAMRVQEVPKRKQIITLLLDHGADIEAESEQGKTLLMLACERRDKVIVDLVLSHKANVNARGNPKGRTALHFAVYALFDAGTIDDMRDIFQVLLAAGANPNLQDNDGLTPLNYLLNPGRPVPFNFGPMQTKIEQLLREHGGVTDLPRLDAIEVRRPGANFSNVIFTKGTNGWDQFSLFDLLGVQYHLLSASPGGDKRSVNAMSPRFAPAGGLPFPDFAHIRIRHPKPDSKGWDERTINISDPLNSGDCSADVPLELGDQVEIPEADHVLNAKWEGFSTNILETLTKCLTRNISVIVKGQSNSISFGPDVRFAGSPGRGFRASPGAVVVNTSVLEFAPTMIKPALEDSKLLLASSDLAHIKLIRKDPNTRQKRELVVDCSYDKPAPSVWLRDGDIIEVPDKP